MNSSLSYDTRSEGDTRTIAAELFRQIHHSRRRYLRLPHTFCRSYQKIRHSGIPRPRNSPALLSAPSDLAGEFTVTYGTTSFKGLEQTVPSNAKMGDFIATASLPDGTEVKFRISVRDRISGPFTVKNARRTRRWASVEHRWRRNLPELTTETTWKRVRCRHSQRCGLSTLRLEATLSRERVGDRQSLQRLYMAGDIGTRGRIPLKHLFGGR